MIGYYINLIFRGASIHRWNNFPRIEHVTETDNLGFVVQTSIILGNIVKEKEKINIDMEYVFKKILMSSFSTLILSDINSQVKSRIKETNPKIYEQLNQKAQNFLLGLNVDEQIKKDIRLCYKKENSDKKIEDNLIKFAKLWVVKQEIKTNKKIYDTTYEQIRQDTEKKLGGKEFDIFNKYLDNNIEKYLDIVRRLQFNFRWNMKSRIHNISVMSHSFIVLFFCYLIGIIEKSNKEDRIEIMTKGVLHDIAESITGDIISPTKKSVKGLEELIGKIEQEMVEEHLLSKIKKYKFTKKIKEGILYPFDGRLGMFVKMGDLLSALFEAEIESNSPEFEGISTKLKRTLNKEGYKSVDYIIKYGLDYFKDNMENIIKF